MAALFPRLFDQENISAPEPVSVVLPPLQIVVIPLMAATGSAFTTTVTISLSVQPLPLVTVTEYTVLMAGNTETTALVPRLFDQL